MTRLFEVNDKSKRSIYLTKERWLHILKHPDMHDQFDFMIAILQRPIKIVPLSWDSQTVYYYGYFKNRRSKAKYLRVVVKYLNGEGFIITAYFVEGIL